MSAEIGAPVGASPIRRVGRPRAFEDADVFAAIRAVLIRDGFFALTLGAVANELDVSTPALARRFGDKRELLTEFLEFTDRRVAEICRDLIARFPSPIDSLRARWKLPIPNAPIEYENREGVQAWVEFLLGIRTDPSYGPVLEQRTQAWIDGVAERLEAAYDAGEIVKTDFNMLAYVLSSAMTGAMLFWFEHRRGDLYEELGRVFEFTMAPYRGLAYPEIVWTRDQVVCNGC